MGSQRVGDDLTAAATLQTYIHLLRIPHQNTRAKNIYQSLKTHLTIKSSCHYIDFILTLMPKSKLKATSFEYTLNTKFKLKIPIVT